MLQHENTLLAEVVGSGSDPRKCTAVSFHLVVAQLNNPFPFPTLYPLIISLNFTSIFAAGYGQLHAMQNFFVSWILLQGASYSLMLDVLDVRTPPIFFGFSAKFQSDNAEPIQFELCRDRATFCLSLLSFLKYLKNCECCPVSLLIVMNAGSEL